MRIKKRFFALSSTLMAAFTFVGGAPSMAQAAQTVAIPGTYATVSVTEAKALIDGLRNASQKFLLLDVRTPEEVAEGFIPGAVNIPLGDLETRWSEIAEYKELPVVVYCRSGNRSARASEFLVSQGFTNVTNVAGGMRDWAQAGYPVARP